MNLTHALKQVTAAFAVLISYTAMPIYAHAAGSSYAVFKVSYSETKSEVVGGVSGTAFFVSDKKAITACHVLNEKSFEPASGFSKTRVWLVHENQKPIELFRNNVTLNCDRDETIIYFSKSKAPPKLVFGQSSSKDLINNTEIESEGFVASSSGPILNWENNNITISSVPSLQRIKTKGVLLRNVQVDLRAQDVTLVKTPSIQLSYKPIVGMSGGPVTIGGKIVAFNSFADPSSRATTWAVLLN